MVEEVISGFGKIDILVNNAGVLEAHAVPRDQRGRMGLDHGSGSQGLLPSGAGRRAAHGGSRRFAGAS